MNAEELRKIPRSESPKCAFPEMYDWLERTGAFEIMKEAQRNGRNFCHIDMYPLLPCICSFWDKHGDYSCSCANGKKDEENDRRIKETIMGLGYRIRYEWIGKRSYRVSW